MRFQWRILMEKIQGWCTYRRTRYSPWVFDVVAECYKFNVPCQKCLICYESQIFSVKNAGSRTFRLLHLIGGKLIMFNHACIWRQSKGWFNECKNLGIYIIYVIRCWKSIDIFFLVPIVENETPRKQLKNFPYF
jgi:hypothetical protein